MFGAWQLPAVLSKSSTSPATICGTYRKVTHTHNSQALSKIWNNSTKMYICLLDLLSLWDFSYLSFMFFFLSVDVDWHRNVFFFLWLFPSFFLFIHLFLFVWSSEDLRMEREKLLRALLMTELWDNTLICLQTTKTTQKEEPLTQCTNVFHCYTAYGPEQTSML